MYAHLDSIDVSKGQQVDKGERIGELGRSCNGADECSSFSTPHVHFAVHRDANFGGSGSGGSYGGRAVIAEPIDGYTGLERGDVPGVIEETESCVAVSGSAFRSIDGHGDEALDPTEAGRGCGCGSSAPGWLPLMFLFALVRFRA